MEPGCSYIVKSIWYHGWLDTCGVCGNEYIRGLVQTNHNLGTSVTDHMNGWVQRDTEWIAGPWFKMKMSSYQYRKSYCGDKTVVRSSYLHNGISYTGKMTSLYWFGTLSLLHQSVDVIILTHWPQGDVIMIMCNFHIHFKDWYFEHFHWNYMEVNVTDHALIVILTDGL